MLRESWIINIYRPKRIQESSQLSILWGFQRGSPKQWPRQWEGPVEGRWAPQLRQLPPEPPRLPAPYRGHVGGGGQEVSVRLQEQSPPAHQGTSRWQCLLPGLAWHRPIAFDKTWLVFLGYILSSIHIIYFLGAMQDVLTRLEFLYPKEMRAWRKECKIRYDRSNMPGIQLIEIFIPWF